MRLNHGLIPISLLTSLLVVGANNKPVTIVSAGSTFIYPILARWSTEYRKLHPEMQISYDPIGSGRGISRTLAGTVDFGASDGPLSDIQIQHAQKRSFTCQLCLAALSPRTTCPG